MTTFQDPPPQSRRAVRQSERGEAAEPPAVPSFVAPQPAPFADQSQRDMWDTTARRVAQLPPAQPRVDGAAPPAGRRAASTAPEPQGQNPSAGAPTGEPLSYVTQQRPQVPTYDGPFRNTPPTRSGLHSTGQVAPVVLPTATPPNPAPSMGEDSMPPTQALPRAEQPTYRVRDYSPEARPAAAAWNAATAPSVAAPGAEAPGADVPDAESAAVPPTDLDYQTEARRLTAVPPLPVEPANVAPPVSAVPPLEVSPLSEAPTIHEAPLYPAPENFTAQTPAKAPESTLSRRELRAMLMAEAANEAAASGQLFEPSPWPAVSPEQVAPAFEPTAQPPVQNSNGVLVDPTPWTLADDSSNDEQLADPPSVLPTQVLSAAPPKPAGATAEVSSDEPQAWPFSFGAPAEASGEVPVEAGRRAAHTTGTIAPVEVPAQAEVTPTRDVAPAPEFGSSQSTVDSSSTSIASTEDDGARSLFGDIMTPIASPLTVTPDVPEPRALPEAAPRPVASTGLSNALTEFDSLAYNVPQQPVQSPLATDSAWSPPVGHWSTQGDLDDEAQPFESAINRRIGSGSATTNALVLPTPDRDIRGALTGTGEVMLTGSIDLPTTLSSTGAHDRVEHESLDMLFDANDHEVVTTDSAPVRAIRAVSTHNTGHGVTHTQKPKGTKSLTVLLFVAGGMAVVGLGMLVVVLVMNVFN